MGISMCLFQQFSETGITLMYKEQFYFFSKWSLNFCRNHIIWYVLIFDKMIIIQFFLLLQKCNSVLKSFYNI